MIRPAYQLAPTLREALPGRRSAFQSTPAGQAARVAQATAQADAVIARGEQARQQRAQAAHATRPGMVRSMEVQHVPSPLPAAAERYAHEQRQRAEKDAKLQQQANAKWGSRKAAMQADPGIFCGV